MTPPVERVQRERARRADVGFTLVELLVTMLLFALVLAAAGALLLNGLNSQRDVVGTGQASNDAQVAISSMERAIRNSSQGGLSVSATTLVAHTGGGDTTMTTTWRCQAWTYVPPVGGETTGRIFSKRGPAGTKLVIPAASAFGATVPAGWMLAVDGVTPPSDPIFAPSATTGSWTIAFQSERINQKKKGAGVVMKTTVTPRPQAVGTTNGGCF